MKSFVLIAFVATIAAAQVVPSVHFGKLSREDLVKSLASENSWERREAQRLLSEKVTVQDKSVIEKLAALATNPAPSVPTRIGALGVLHASGTLSEKSLDEAARDALAEIRAASARFTGERHDPNSTALRRLEKLASDSEPTVRAAVAAALREFTSSSLTVNTSPRTTVETEKLFPHFKELIARPSVEGDTYYPHIVWMAMEPRVAANPQPFFPLLAANENSVSAYCTRRVMRRICDLSDTTARAQHLNTALQWLGDNAAKTQLASAALDGLIEAAKSKGAPPTIDLQPIFAKLTANPVLAEKARRLATLLGDTSASRMLLARINDARASVEDRLKGIQAARETKDDVSRAELLRLIAIERQNQTLLTEGLRALSTFGGDDIGYAITDAWKRFSLPTRRIASEVLVIRSKWSRALLAAVDQKIADPQDISATARRSLARSEDATVRDNAERLLGRYRATGADKLKLIADKRAVVLSGTPDLNNGQEVAKRACFVCHKLYGEGTDIGPDLTGVGRSTLDALLHNIIDPNEVIGNGFEVTEVTLKDDSTVSGRVVEETDTRVKLVASGPMEHTIAKGDIKVVNGKPAIRKTELSLMPEGLEQIPDKDFRDLIMFILNPPGDKRPWTPALRKELIGDEQPERKAASAKQ